MAGKHPPGIPGQPGSCDGSQIRSPLLHVPSDSGTLEEWHTVTSCPFGVLAALGSAVLVTTVLRCFSAYPLQVMGSIPGVDSVLCKELLRYTITPDCKFPPLLFHLLIPPILLYSSGMNQQQLHVAKGGSALRWEFAHRGYDLTASACPAANSVQSQHADSSTKLTLLRACSECACSKQTSMKQITYSRLSNLFSVSLNWNFK